MPFTINPFTVKPLRTDQREHLVRPFMRWVGGKQRLIGNLLDNIPAPGTYQKYCEAFLGAGSLFLAGNHPKALLNDLNFHLINTYRQVRDHPEELHHLIYEHALQLRQDHRRNFNNDWANYTTERSKASYYYTVRNAYNANLDLPDDEFHPEHLQQAARFLFLIHSNYNGLFRVNKSGGYNVPFGKKLTHVPKLEHLQQISQKLQGANLTNKSFEELEPEIDHQTFVYLDPPYPDAHPNDLFNQRKSAKNGPFTSYNAPPFGHKEHNELAAFANRLKTKGAQIMISIAEPINAPEDDPRRVILREWYPEEDWCYHGTQFKRTIGPRKNPQTVQELILTSYETKECIKKRRKAGRKKGGQK